jgi:hypothetical protein
MYLQERRLHAGVGQRLQELGHSHEVPNDLDGQVPMLLAWIQGRRL